MLQRFVDRPIEALGRAHIEQSLGKQAHPFQDLRQGFLLVHAGLQHLQSADHAVTGAVLIQSQQMARTLATQ